MVNIDYYINNEGLYRNKMEYCVNLCSVLKWGFLVIIVDVIVEDYDVVVVDVGGGVLILFVERLYNFI